MCALARLGSVDRSSFSFFLPEQVLLVLCTYFFTSLGMWRWGSAWPTWQATPPSPHHMHAHQKHRLVRQCPSVRVPPSRGDQSQALSAALSTSSAISCPEREVEERSCPSHVLPSFLAAACRVTPGSSNDSHDSHDFHCGTNEPMSVVERSVPAPRQTSGQPIDAWRLCLSAPLPPSVAASSDRKRGRQE